MSDTNTKKKKIPPPPPSSSSKNKQLNSKKKVYSQQPINAKFSNNEFQEVNENLNFFINLLAQENWQSYQGADQYIQYFVDKYLNERDKFLISSY